MDKSLHHTKVSELTGYSTKSLYLFVKTGVIKCKRDVFGLPRFDMKTVALLIARGEKFKRQRAAAKKRRP
jgi:hypothetical protein